MTTDCLFLRKFVLRALIAAALALPLVPQQAFAACSNPSGTEGEIIYNSSYHITQFCDGSSWISMAAAATYLNETDPKIGTLTALKWCATNAGGTAIDCTLDAPLRTANNLSDLGSATTARTNLGLGTMATQAASAVTITGGTINGTAIGGSTPAAGAFTTLSASGATTLSTTLGVTGATTLSSTLGVTGATTLSSTLAVTGDATFDATTLKVDAANNRVGIGTAAPSYTLDVSGQTKSTSILFPTTAGYAQPTGSGSGWIVSGSDVIFSGGNVGIGSNTPAVALDVVGAGAFTGNITIGGTLGVTGNFAVNTNKFNVTGASGNTTVAGTLGVTGAATLSSTLGVTGDVAVNTNKLTVAASSGNTVVAGTLNVTGTITGPGSGITALNAGNLASGTVATARLGSGSADNTVFLRGDSAWAAPTASVADGDKGDITVSSSGAVWAIDSGAVTNAMLGGSIASSKLVGTDIATVGTITSGTWSGTAVGVAYGGTGAATLTSNGVLYGNGTSAVQITAQGAANSILTANGGAPAFSASPTIGTSVTTPLVIGGTAASSTLTLESTSGTGTSDAIVFKTGSQSEKMRIDTSGNVGIGTINPTGRLYVSGTAANGTSPQVRIDASDAGRSLLGFYQSATAKFVVGVSGGAGENIAGSASGDATIRTQGGKVLFSTDSGLTAHLTIDGSNVGIGTTGFAIGGKLNVLFNGSSEQGIIVKNSANNQSGGAIRFIDSGDAYSGGGIYFASSNAITYATSSDLRLKENIHPAQDALPRLTAIEVVDFNFKSDPDKKQVNGFIAQDLYKAYPEAVVVGDEDVKKKAWSVDYGRITPLLVKAMQELKSLFDGDHAELVKLKAANDNQSAALKAANNNTAALRKEFEAYKTAHP